MIDENALKNHFDNDVEMIHEILKIFCETYPESLSLLENALEQKEIKNIEFHAHTLKGMISNFFCDELTEAALFIENSNRNNQLEVCDEKVKLLKEKLPLLVEKLRDIK